MDNYENQCQSCGMPLEKGLKSGTETDGSKSHKFCVLCYQNGAFIEPNMTLEDMKKRLDETVGKEGIKGKVIAFLGKMQLPSLERWKNK